MNSADRIAKANRAADLLGELEWVFAEVREDMTRALEASALGDVDTHHTIAISLQALKMLRGKLQSVVDDGRLAAAEQEQDNWIRRLRKRGTV